MTTTSRFIPAQFLLSQVFSNVRPPCNSSSRATMRVLKLGPDENPLLILMREPVGFFHSWSLILDEDTTRKIIHANDETQQDRMMSAINQPEEGDKIITTTIPENEEISLLKKVFILILDEMKPHAQQSQCSADRIHDLQTVTKDLHRQMIGKKLFWLDHGGECERLIHRIIARARNLHRVKSRKRRFEFPQARSKSV